MHHVWRVQRGLGCRRLCLLVCLLHHWSCWSSTAWMVVLTSLHLQLHKILERLVLLLLLLRPLLLQQHQLQCSSSCSRQVQQLPRSTMQL